MLEHLFGSKTRIKLLRVFFQNPNKAYYVRELTRVLDTQINAARRELQLLLKSGLVIETDMPKSVDRAKAGSALRKYYRLATTSVLYPEMRALLFKAQLLGEQKMVEEIQKKGGDIKLFIITGKFTGDMRAESDMLLVGKLKDVTIANIVTKYEKDFGFSIRYTTMDMAEFQDRRHVMDKFLYSLFEAKHERIIDTINV